MSYNSGKESIKELAQDIKAYVEKRLEVFILDSQDKVASLISAVAGNILGVALVLIACLFLLITAALGIGYVVNNNVIGFGAVSLLLLLPGMYVLKFKRNKLKQIMKEKIVRFIDKNMRDSE